MTPDERLAKIAELIGDGCREPGVYDGMDMCTCGSGEVWPCSRTRAAWLARGLDIAEETRRQLEPGRQRMLAEEAAWEALNEEDPEAARRYALRQLGW